VQTNHLWVTLKGAETCPNTIIFIPLIHHYTNSHVNCLLFEKRNSSFVNGFCALTDVFVREAMPPKSSGGRGSGNGGQHGRAGSSGGSTQTTPRAPSSQHSTAPVAGRRPPGQLPFLSHYYIIHYSLTVV
jgi:hypothetical protein